MSCLLNFARERHIYDLQRDFSACYPYLRLNFYRQQETESNGVLLKPVPQSSLLAAAGLVKSGNMTVSDSMKVEELETALKNQFGLTVQVFRHSGNIWLETVLTDKWTLQQQNEHGKELCTRLVREDSPEDSDLNRGSL